MSTIVKTRQELDAALADGKADIIIDSPRGVWLTVSGSATVRAWGSATVEASGSATVEASDSATVEAWGSATVRASGSATVEAWGSATVEAWGSATVRAGKYVAVHIHSQRVTISGGVVIDMTALDRSDPATWCDLNGLDVADGKAVVYKVVDADLNAGHGYTLTAYPVGSTVTASDWHSEDTCGGGLHFGRSPMAAAEYHRGDTGPRYLACEVDLSEVVVVLDDTIKARSCRVLHEVDRLGREVSA